MEPTHVCMIGAGRHAARIVYSCFRCSGTRSSSPTQTSRRSARRKLPARKASSRAGRFRRHPRNVHLNDLDADGKFYALGQGVSPLESILEALVDVRYGQWLIVDGETASMDTDAAFRVAADYLCRAGALGAAGAKG
jgi:hypothetical protein